jgi:hypothetical protein
MSAPFVPALDTFAGGQMTDLPAFTATALDGTELFEIVSGYPSTPTNANNAVNYSITSELLAALLFAYLNTQVVLVDGQNNTSGNPYVVPFNVGRVYVNKTSAEPTYIQFAAANTYITEPLVTDIAGTVNGTGDGITVTFSGGQEADGLTTVPITTPYGGYIFRPVTSLNTWHLGAA